MYNVVTLSLRLCVGNGLSVTFLTTLMYAVGLLSSSECAHTYLLRILAGTTNCRTHRGSQFKDTRNTCSSTCKRQSSLSCINRRMSKRQLCWPDQKRDVLLFHRSGQHSDLFCAADVLRMYCKPPCSENDIKTTIRNLWA
jgi:hypothetical protein